MVVAAPAKVAGILVATLAAVSGSAVIAIDGSYGTLSEIAHALQYGKPVVLLASWTFSAGGHESPPVIHATDPVDAVEKAIAAAGAPGKGPATTEHAAHGN